MHHEEKTTRRSIRGLMAVGLLLGTVTYAVAEDMILTLHYPVPLGVYEEIRTRSNTYLAINQAIVPPARVGMGTTAPQKTLWIVGNATFQGPLRMTAGGPVANAVLVAKDAAGNAAWLAFAGTYGYF